jgi:maleate cis-trans isomerase
MPGGNWPSMSVVDRLERELGKPVLANNAVSLWAGLRLLGRRDSIAGYGWLLREELRQDGRAVFPSEGRRIG